ncbi:hypothetical protein [Spirosoma flavum]|uniref:Uncharacterized protein n=1 Tax=Spirosoma flavum TaxID=2048557 RepID=A0ABW6ALD5_9BACT
MRIDAKTIYIASSTYLPKVEWEKQNGNEWIYVGVDQDFDEGKITQSVYATFDTDDVYVVTDRHNSHRASLADAIKSVKEGLEKEGYLLWNLSFDRVVEFGRIGVLRKGKRG